MLHSPAPSDGRNFIKLFQPFYRYVVNDIPGVADSTSVPVHKQQLSVLRK